MAAVSANVDPVWLAMSRLRRRRFGDCVALCDSVLSNPTAAASSSSAPGADLAALSLKTRALTAAARGAVDDADLDVDGVAELLFDDSGMAAMPRPGTSLLGGASGQGGAGHGGWDQNMRPVSVGGRPLTGFARPGTHGGQPGGVGRLSASRSGSRGGDAVAAAFGCAQPGGGGARRPATSLGREVRAATASLAIDATGRSLDPNKLNPAKVASRPALAVAVAEYLLYHERDPAKSLEIAAEATRVTGYKSWFWKYHLGKCYARLGLWREAEKQLKSSLKLMDSVAAHLELSKVYLRLDVPHSALRSLKAAQLLHPLEPRLSLGRARIFDLLGDAAAAADAFRQVLSLDAAHVEAIASLAASHFYQGQSELALRYYRRLLQMGAGSRAEVWANLGLCCYYAGHLDMCLGCFAQALDRAEADHAANEALQSSQRSAATTTLVTGSGLTLATVWFNLSHVAVGLGDAPLALQVKTPVRPPTVTDSALKAGFPLRATANATQVLTVANAIAGGSASGSLGSLGSGGGGGMAEAVANLAVFELRRQDHSAAAIHLAEAQRLGPQLFEPFFNGALAAARAGKSSETTRLAALALAAFPGHLPSQQLVNRAAPGLVAMASPV